MAMAPIAREAAEEWQQDGDPGDAENDRNIRNPNPIGEDFVEADDDDPAPEVAIAAVVADEPIEYEDGFIPWGDLNLPDVHRKSSALDMPPPVEDSPESPGN